MYYLNSKKKVKIGDIVRIIGHSGTAKIASIISPESEEGKDLGIEQESAFIEGEGVGL